MIQIKFFYFDQNSKLHIAYKHFRDGRLQIGDEIVNVNGRRLRGLSMSSAKEILNNYITSENFTKTMNTKRYERSIFYHFLFSIYYLSS